MQHVTLPDIAKVMNVSDLGAFALHIPAYQRLYSWQPEHAEQMFNDMVDDFRPGLMALAKGSAAGGTIQASLFYGRSTMGTLVAYESLADNGTTRMSIVDGQQRITTLTLLAAALRSKLREYPNDPRMQPILQEIERFLGYYQPMQLIATMDTRLTPRGEDEQAFLKALVNTPKNVEDSIEEQARDIFQKANKRKQFDAQDSGVPALYRVYSALRETLEQAITDLEDEVTENLPMCGIKSTEILLLLGNFFTHYVIFIRRLCSSEEEAIREFEKLNNRGKTLSNLDILRAKMMGLDGQGIDGPVCKAMDRASNALPGGSSHARVFIRAMAMGGLEWSTFAPTAKPLDTFIGKNSDKNLHAGSVQRIADDMAQAAEAYACFHRREDAHGQPNANLANIHSLGVYPILMPILLAARKMRPAVFREFVRLLEAAVYVYLVSGETSQKPLEMLLAKWCRDAQSIVTFDDLEGFARTHYQAGFLGPRYGERFLRGIERLSYANSFDRKRIRLLLERCAYDLQGVPSSNSSGISTLPIRMGTPFDIEHIVARDQALPAYGQAGDGVGNLTLLETTQNRALKNSDLSTKLPAYSNSALWMTSALVPGASMGQVRKTATKIVTLPDQHPVDASWLQQRTQQIITQSRRIWGIDGWTVDRTDFKVDDHER